MRAFATFCASLKSDVPRQAPGWTALLHAYRSTRMQWSGSVDAAPTVAQVNSLFLALRTVLLTVCDWRLGERAQTEKTLPWRSDAEWAARVRKAEWGVVSASTCVWKDPESSMWANPGSKFREVIAF